MKSEEERGERRGEAKVSCRQACSELESDKLSCMHEALRRSAIAATLLCCSAVGFILHESGIPPR